MPVIVTWENDDKKVLRLLYEEPLTVADLEQMDAEVLPMLESVSHPVVAVSDARAIYHVPQGLLTSFPLLARNKSFQHPNLRASIIVTENTTFEALMSVFRKLYGKIKFARTPEEALRLINEGKV